MKNYADITVLLDRSGSMASIKEDMEGGFKEFIKAHKKNPATRITLVQFDGSNPYDVVYTALPAKNIGALNLVPGSSTPLIDAFVRTIDETGLRLSRISKSDRPSKVLFVVITDGQENSSRLHTSADLKSRVETQHDTYKWEFIYLGANQDAIREAHKYGISPMFAAEFGGSGAEAYSALQLLVDKSSAYASMRGRAEDMTFSNADRKLIKKEVSKVS